MTTMRMWVIPIVVAVLGMPACSSEVAPGDSGTVGDSGMTTFCTTAAQCAAGWSCESHPILSPLRYCVPGDAGDAGDVDAGGELADAAGLDAPRSSSSAPFPLASSPACAAGGVCDTDPPRPDCCLPLGDGTATGFGDSGVFIEDSIELGSTSISEIDLAITMLNAICEVCGLDDPNTWDVAINGRVVGSYAFTVSDPCWVGTMPMRCECAPVVVNEHYAFAPIDGVGASSRTYRVRITATSNVCLRGGGGGGWNWTPGGTITAR